MSRTSTAFNAPRNSHYESDWTEIQTFEDVLEHQDLAITTEAESGSILE